MATRQRKSIVPPRLVFVTRRNCPLCDEALANLQELVAPGEVEIVDVDVRGGLDEYDARVPVILDPDGDVVIEGRFSKAELRKALRKAKRWPFGRVH